MKAREAFNQRKRLEVFRRICRIYNVSSPEVAFLLDVSIDTAVGWRVGLTEIPSGVLRQLAFEARGRRPGGRIQPPPPLSVRPLSPSQQLHRRMRLNPERRQTVMGAGAGSGSRE